MTGTFIERRAPSPAPGVLFAVIPISSLLPLPHECAASFCLIFCYRLNCAPEKLNAVLTAGQGSLACCSPWDREESDMTERLNANTNDNC